MYFGAILLIAAAVVVYLGFAQRALDRLRLSDRAAIGFIIAILVGGFLPDIPIVGGVSVNIGGGIVPLVLAGYLWSRAESHEIVRSIIAIIVAGAAVYLLMKVLPTEPTYARFMDPLYAAALVAGVVGYIAGRSRRGAFMAGSLAIIINDVAVSVENAIAGVAPSAVIGGAGMFDAVIIAGLLALGLAEVLGESLEYVSRRES